MTHAQNSSVAPLVNCLADGDMHRNVQLVRWSEIR